MRLRPSKSFHKFDMYPKYLYLYPEKTDIIHIQNKTNIMGLFYLFVTVFFFFVK